jgi:hypothetical protein
MLLRCFALAQCHTCAAAVTCAHRQLRTQGLVEEWGRLLMQAPQQATLPAPAAAILADMKQMLRQAVKTQSQRLSGGVVPDTVSAAFTRLYRSSAAAAEQPAFFRLLVAELGVQGKVPSSCPPSTPSLAEAAHLHSRHSRAHALTCLLVVPCAAHASSNRSDCFLQRTM